MTITDKPHVFDIASHSDFPHFRPSCRSRGELKRLSGDFQGSIEDLDRSLQLEPQNAVALSSRGDAKRMLDDFQGALADLTLGSGWMDPVDEGFFIQLDGFENPKKG
jgi:tetratricopeptide (TPR) repeat protein